MKSISLCCLLLVLTAYIGYGCTIPGKSFAVFDDSEYVFIATVIGYTEPVPFDEKKANRSVEPMSLTQINPASKQAPVASGLIVKVKESVHLPKQRAEFEVFPLDLLADCSVVGAGVDRLKKEFPVNSEVRIIAKEAIFVSDPKAARTRLEDRPSESGQIILNSDGTSSKLTNGTTEFNYKSYVFDINASDSHQLLPNFELRKDLLRLKQARTQNGRNAVLDRLLHAPVNTDIDFHDLFRTYAASETEANRYFENQLKIRDPELYKQYVFLENVISQLAKLGHSRSVAEKAITTAWNEGSAIDDKDLLKKCIAILSRPITTTPK